MCCCCSDGCYTVLFSIITLVELGCGLVSTGTSSFFNDGANLWAYALFGLYAVFAAGIFYLMTKEIYFNEDTSSSINWICGLCTVATMGTMVIIYAFVKPTTNVEYIHGALGVALAALFFLSCVATCYSDWFLALGWDGRRRERERQRAMTNIVQSEGPAADGERTLGQSLAQMVNHVQNNPTHKTYKMYAAGSGTPFEVVV